MQTKKNIEDEKEAAQDGQPPLIKTTGKKKQDGSPNRLVSLSSLYGNIIHVSCNETGLAKSVQKVQSLL